MLLSLAVFFTPTASLEAQDAGADSIPTLKFYNLVLGQSSPAALASFSNEQLRCQVLEKIDTSFTGCAATEERSPHRTRGLFRHNRLIEVIYVFGSEKEPETLLREFQRRFGSQISMKVGQESKADLRYYEFDVEPFVMYLAEVRLKPENVKRMMVVVRSPEANLLSRPRGSTLPSDTAFETDGAQE